MEYLWFAIKHKPSGLYLPAASGRYGRGFSFKEPSEERPRLFHTKRGAINALYQWLRGHHRHSSGFDSFNSEYYEETKVLPQPHRKREEMEVVPLMLVPLWEKGQQSFTQHVHEGVC